MAMNFKKNTAYIGGALGTAFAVGLAASSVASAETGSNPFLVADLGSGYMVAAKDGEGKCGEGKCGGDRSHGGEMGAKKDGEGKCGEGKCGGDKSHEGEKGKKGGEGKCGEGKCGG